MRRSLSLAFVAASTTALTAGALSAPATSVVNPQSSRAQRSVAAPAIDWGDCEDPFLQDFSAQCGFVTVPLDYAARRAEDQTCRFPRDAYVPDARHQGIMLMNRGAPGVRAFTLPFGRVRAPRFRGELRLDRVRPARRRHQ